MKAAHREAMAQVRRVVEPKGLTARFEDHGQKHKAIWIEGRSFKGKITISGSPRSGPENAGDWARQSAVKLLKRKGWM